MPRPSDFDRRSLVAAGLAAGVVGAPAAALAADSAPVIVRRARDSLAHLYATNATAKAIGASARAVLVFPSIVKAGFVVGGMGGDGALLTPKQVLGFYRIVAGSVGFQLGAQTFSYAMFLINEKAVQHARSSNGWAVGVGPSLVFVDAGASKNLDTTNLSKDIYAFAYGERGLMGGITLDGSKISKITPSA
jgi:lipid-binding SYLF domain-containing protein